ncbi:MAG: lysophospholipid acyltransferase family protein [Balneolaceae bacterium]|nr:MAG: lysophospholipid acyltransferase family protein [Balneolaceae bacterium]
MVPSRPDKKIFKLDVDFDSRYANKLFGMVKRPLEKILSMDELNLTYWNARDVEENDRHFSVSLLESMNVRYEITDKDLLKIPKTGKIVVVSNHPFGGIEGVIMGAILKSVRPDSRIMANFLLERVPELRDLFIFVNPFGSKSAVRANINSLKFTIEHLNNGGALGVFPAGEVAHMKWSNREISDPEWSDTIARIIRKTECPVLPMYFNGFNGMIFQLAGLIHPRLRTMMLPREFVNKVDKKIEIRIGKLIPFSKIKSFETDAEAISYLRQRTMLLKNRDEADKDESRSSMAITMKKEGYAPVIDPVDSELLEDDIVNLPARQKLLESGEFDVYYANFKQIPNIMREIGRLREIAFRDTDEGTGKELDLDWYDEHYMHLFIWNREKRELVGAYRLGRTDNICKKIGSEGLYTTTLFKIKKSLLQDINPALEMGRSFIRPEYQRSFAPLLLLWKGIGHYVHRYPKYKILFGPVSISNDYETSSRQLMVAFLMVHNFLPEMAKKVKPVTPFKSSGKIRMTHGKKDKGLIDIDDVSDMISDIEEDKKGIPILLKQYLKLGGKLLGFNVDPSFADALDGLILVDLTKTDPRILNRYMPKGGIEEFLEYHSGKAKAVEGEKSQ